MANRGEYTQVIELEAEGFVSGAEQASAAANKLAHSINGASQGAANLGATTARAGGSVEVFKQEADAVARVNQETRGLMDSRRGLMALASGLRSAGNVATAAGAPELAGGLNIAAGAATTAGLAKLIGPIGLAIGGVELLSSSITGAIAKIKENNKVAGDLGTTYFDMASKTSQAIEAIKSLKTSDQATDAIKRLKDEIAALQESMKRPGFNQADSGPIRQMIQYYERLIELAQQAREKMKSGERFRAEGEAQQTVSDAVQKINFEKSIEQAPTLAEKMKLISAEAERLGAVADKAQDALKFATTMDQIKNLSQVYIEASIAAAQLLAKNEGLANSFMDVRKQREQQVKETEKDAQQRMDKIIFGQRLSEAGTPQEQRDMLTNRISQIESALGKIDLKGAASRVEPGVFDAELKKYQELTAEMFDLMEKRSSIENKKPREGEDIFGVFTSNLTRVGGGGRGGLILLPEKMEELISVAKAMDIKLGEIRTQNVEEPVYG